MKHRRTPPQPSRREALRQIGIGLGATAVGGCMPEVGQCVSVGSGADAPAGTARRLLSGIEAMVVVILENRSFDHQLGGLRLDASYPARARVDALRGDEVQYDRTGRACVVWPQRRDGRFNPPHKWDPVHAAWNEGRLDRFYEVAEGPQRDEVMSYHERERLPFHYALAEHFTVCDRWFASVMGPTWPNRFHFQAATSGGRRDNTPFGLNAPATIWERLAERCVDTKNYFAGPAPFYAAGFPAKAASGNSAVTTARIEEFFHDARTGNLPPFSILDPDFFSNDGHPVHDLALCEAFLASVFKAMADGPQWKRSLLVITYDEHGGFFDHVPPPPVVDDHPDFRRLGFRVPALVIGGQVWRGGVVSQTLEHVSIPATLATRFGIESLSTRMDAANDLSACIDPALALDPAPPPRKMPLIEMKQETLMAALHRPPSQKEIAQAWEEHRLDERHVDTRSADERVGAWLRYAQELEALRVVR